MPFGLKNAGETYMKAMKTMFHDMMHREIEVYVDDVIIKSKKQSKHVKELRRFFERLRRYTSSSILQNVYLEYHRGSFWGL